MIRFTHLSGGPAEARLGEIRLGRRSFQTPQFMPVGTQATVKGLTPGDLRKLGAEIILCNTYHLMIRPGAELIRKMGGLHRFMAWNRGILTDSGGFQVFSLQGLRKVDDQGVSFRSHLDGSLFRVSPEDVIDLQRAFGSNIIMPLDVCAPYPADHSTVAEALRRTQDWLRRSRDHWARSRQTLFGIVQGGVWPDLRREAALQAVELDLPGYALGGLSVGEPKDEMLRMIEICSPILPVDRPRYLMGVGMPSDLLEGVARGVDLFDCVLPTRMARNGTLFTNQGRLVIRHARHRESDEPIDPTCGCPTCRTFSRGYLRHLFQARELLAYRANTVHNVYFYLDLMDKIRQSLRAGDFSSLYNRLACKFKELGI